jgi:hypothetical protein
MGFATSSDLRPIWSRYPSYKFLQMMGFMESIVWLAHAAPDASYAGARNGTRLIVGRWCRQQWRATMDISEHMEVVDANDQHIGIVQSVDGDRINLVKDDALDSRHPFINKSQVAAVDGNKVRLAQKVSAITTRAFVSPERAEDESMGKKHQG